MKGHLRTFNSSSRHVYRIKVLMQGIQRCTHFLYCSKHNMDICHSLKWNPFSGYRKLLCEFSKLSKLNAFILLGYYTNTDASILVYKIPAKESWFQYVRRVYTTAINFPSIITLTELSKCGVYTVQ